MSRTVSHNGLLTLAICLSCMSRFSVAADLRSTIDDRTIVRTVSVEQAVESELELESDAVPDAVPLEQFGFDESCGPSCGPDACRIRDNTWAGLEYLLWYREGRFFPPLVTTTPNAGVLPQATVLFGGDDLQEPARPGGRLDVGHWFDDGHCLGIGGALVVLGESTVGMSLNSSDLRFFARPFFDASNNDTSTAQAISSNLSNPTTLGTLNLQTGSEFLATDVYVRWLLLRTCGVRLDLLGGYQFARIAEDLVINTFTQTQPGGLPSLAVQDSFSTRNEYNAGHFGLLGDYRRGPWGLELLARFGFGTMRQTVSINGSSTAVDANGGTSTRASGLLAQLTNSGVHTQDTFSFMNDAGVKLAYYPTERLKLSLGYSLMYWSSVVRPGQEIDLSVDSRLFTGNVAGTTPTHPAFAFDPTHFVVHGLNAGLELRF
jgi:hypothetical protein